MSASGRIQNEGGPNPAVPRMSDLVGETVQNRRVTCVDLSCNVVVTVIGLAMIIFATVICVNIAQEFGWSTSKIPLYSIMGAVGIAGTVVTVLSIKWIVEGCEKWSKFRNNISEVT